MYPDTADGMMCIGPIDEKFDKKFTPNGEYNCHKEYPSSRKCANNKMYKNGSGNDN